MVNVGKGSSNMPAFLEKTPAGGRLGGPDSVTLAGSVTSAIPNADPVPVACAVVGEDAGAGSGAAAAKTGTGIGALADSDTGTDSAPAESPGGGGVATSLRGGSSCAACIAHFANPKTLPKKPSEGCPPAWFRIA